MPAGDTYALESGGPDGYLLEDGSGVLLLESACWQTPALIQQATGSGSGTSFTVTLPSDPQAGGTLFFTGTDDTNPAGATVTGGGATWTLVASEGNNGGAFLWVGDNCSGGAGLNVITYNMASSASVRVGNVSEFSGLAASSLDTSAHASTGSGTAKATPALTPNVANALIIGMLDWGFPSTPTIGAAGGGFTNLTQPPTGTSSKTIAAYRVVSSIAAYTASWTLSANALSDQIIASFKAAACIDYDPATGAGHYAPYEPSDWADAV